jgi:predicted  nucleic acid-binding Zn-ribbon protein
VAQEDLEAPSAELTDALQGVRQSIDSGNEALDGLELAMERRIESGKARIQAVRTQVTGKVRNLKTEAEELAQQLQSAKHDVHGTKEKCVDELSELTASLSRFDGQIAEFVGICRTSLARVTSDLDALDSLIRSERDDTRQRFDAWVGLVPGAQNNLTQAQIGYAGVVTTLLNESDAAYRQLSSDASTFSQNTSQDLRALTASFSTAAVSLISSTDLGLRQALSTLQQNALEAEQTLDGAVGKIEKAAQKIDNDAGTVIETVGKVADLLAAIKPVTDTLSSVV